LEFCDVRWTVESFFGCAKVTQVLNLFDRTVEAPDGESSASGD
jgi:hypothetical protein